MQTNHKNLNQNLATLKADLRLIEIAKGKFAPLVQTRSGQESGNSPKK